MARGKNFIKLGMRFGLLVVIRRALPNEITRGAGREARWVLKCDCGQERIAKARRLTSSKVRACGVNGHRWRSPGSGMEARSKRPEYKVWAGMKARCFNPNSESYPDYGGRGITVCDRWRDSFEAFFEDMGERPSAEYSIDRWPDCNGNYEPGNCRWATAREQSLNTRRSVYVDVNGEKILLNEYARALGLSATTIYGRLKLGWTLEEAVTVPVKRYRKKPLVATTYQC